MAIVIQCPACQVRSQVPDTVSGRSVRCKKCGQKFTVQQTQAGSRSDTKSSQPTSSKDLFPVLPAEFGRYRLLSLLGQGGMGAVYLAEDTQLRRQVALKLPFFDTKESPQRAERFIREAQSAASLHHPNICTVFDTGRIDGRPFLTMAYIQGIGLDRMTDPDHLLPAPQVVDMIRKVALALAEAHSKGIIHRDLKPANIMLATSGEPVVMDFGLAKRSTDSDASDAKLTRDGGVIGTPSYMSPEQVRGDNSAIGAATDIYSLGVVLYELLAGRTPFVGGMGAVMGQILAAPVPPLTDFRPDADPQLDSICRTAMAKSPADRFASMLAFAQALSKYLTSESAISVELVETPVQRPPAPMVYVPTPSTVAQVATKKTLSQATAPAESFDQLTDSSPRKKKTTKKQIRNPWIGRGIAIGIALAILGPLAWFGVTLLRVETPNGTLIVEISDEEVEAKIKGGRLILSGQDGKERYTLSPTERNKKIDAGDYMIHVEGADGLTLDTPEFTLKKGDKVTVRVTLQKKDVTKVEPKKEDPSVVDPDRKAAEYVLSIGGRVRLNNEGGDILSQADLPRGKFQLTHAFIYECPATNEGLAAFVGCEHLIELALTNSKITDKGVEYFSKTSTLLNLNLRYTNLTQTGLKSFSNNRQLQILTLDDTKISDLGLSHFNSCSNLIGLGLQATNISDDGLLKMANLNNLTSLNLSGTKLTEKGFAKLKDTTEINHLRLTNMNLTGDSLANLSQCKKLQGVDLSDSRLNDLAMSHISFENAVWVKLANTQITDRSLIKFENCTQLNELDLVNTNVTAEGVATLQAKTPRLKIHWFPPKQVATPAAEGFTQLFNGKDLTGWVVDGSCKKEEWKVANGTVSVSGGPRPTWGFLLTEKDYSDFLLKLQFQQKVEGAKTGIVIRGIPGQQFMNLPYQCKINLKSPDDTGALLWSNDSAYHKPTKRAQLKPTGEWNDLELELFGQNLRVMVNGDIVQDVKLDDLAGSPKSLAALKRQAGRIGLQKVEGDVAFRNIEIKELTAKKSAEPKPSEFVPLFNGEDLTGWKTHGSQPGNWRVEKGILIGASPNVSHLYTNRADYTNFHLRIETRVNKNGNSGVNLRVPFGPASPRTKPQWVLGYNVKLDEKRLGGLLAGEDSSVHRDLVSTATLGEWMTLEIIATGNNVEVKINGVTTVTFQDPKKQYLSGHIALQQHTAGTVAEFRKIEIKELPAEPKDRGSLDADRKSAEYVLSIGGFVKVNDLNTEIRAVGDLPKEPFRLTFASLASNKVTDAGLVAFEGCTSLTFLEIRSIEVGDAGLAHFKDCQGLKYLCLYMTKVTNQGLSPFAHCKDLKVLVLAECGRVGDAGLIHFKDCDEMTKIELPGTQVSDVGLAHFKNKPKMVELRLQGLAGVTDTGLSNFLGCDELKFVFLEGTKVTQEGKQNLKKKFPNIGFY